MKPLSDNSKFRFCILPINKHEPDTSLNQSAMTMNMTMNQSIVLKEPPNEYQMRP